MAKSTENMETHSSTAAGQTVYNPNSGAAGRVNQTQLTSQMTNMGNILNTRVDGLNEYPHYLQNSMDRNENYQKANPNAGNNSIIAQRLTFYQDWRAKLAIAPITCINYAERNYAMFGRGGGRTLESGAIVDEFNNQLKDTRMGFLRVLTELGGILFPYTPTINVSGGANWQVTKLPHSNINYPTWENSDPEQYDITGDFTASNPSEALYCLAILNFLRTIVKGSGPNYNGGSENRLAEDFGLGRTGNGKWAGMAREVPGAPPPVLYFSAYGHGMINEVPVVVQNYSYSLAKDIDYVELILEPNTWTINTDSSIRRNNEAISDMVIARVPTKFSLTLKLLTTINPIKYQRFSLWDYKNGEYIKPLSKDYGFNSGWTW